MVTLPTVVVVAVRAGIALQEDCTERPQHVFGSTQRKVAAGAKLTGNQTDLHRCRFIVLLLPGLQVSRVDTTALLQKITDGERTFVIDNTRRFIAQLIAELRNEALNGDSALRARGRDRGADI